MTLHIRTAKPGDAGLVLDFIRKLAAYENRLDEVVAGEAELDAALFGETARAYCDIAEWEGTPVGFAVWFYNFSTFRGRPGLYLEDLFVRPDHRGQGIGEALLRHLARLAVQRGCARMEWAVLNWNKRAIEFYERACADREHAPSSACSAAAA